MKSTQFSKVFSIIFFALLANICAVQAAGYHKFVNNPVQRKLCRVKKWRSTCEEDKKCAWNDIQRLCNEFGHQPNIQDCTPCQTDGVPAYAESNNGYWRADKGVEVSKTNPDQVTQWSGLTKSEELLAVQKGFPAPILALPKSSQNSHPQYPAIYFDNGSGLISTVKHPSGCGESWTWFVVLKPAHTSWSNIFSTMDAPADRLNNHGYNYFPWSITPTGVHGWASAPNWSPGTLSVNKLQVVAYSTEKTKGLTINYYEQGKSPREYRNDGLNQVCTGQGYVVMGRGTQNNGHNYKGLIYEAITFPRFMKNDEIRVIANKLLDKYAV